MKKSQENKDMLMWNKTFNFLFTVARCVLGSISVNSVLSVYFVWAPKKRTSRSEYSDTHTQSLCSYMINSADYSFFHYCAHPLLPFFISHFFSLSSLSMSLAFFLFFSPPLPILLPYLLIVLCQYADRLWGLGKERDIKSELWLCVCFSSQGCD